ncbi:MAG: hypothetical protein ABGY24_10680, partial [bacterium]
LNYVASESAANQEVRGLGRSDRGANSFTLMSTYYFMFVTTGGPKSRVTPGGQPRNGEAPAPPPTLAQPQLSRPVVERDGFDLSSDAA